MMVAATATQAANDGFHHHTHLLGELPPNFKGDLASSVRTAVADCFARHLGSPVAGAPVPPMAAVTPAPTYGSPTDQTPALTGVSPTDTHPANGHPASAADYKQALGHYVHGTEGFAGTLIEKMHAADARNGDDGAWVLLTGYRADIDGDGERGKTAHDLLRRALSECGIDPPQAIANVGGVGPTLMSTTDAKRNGYARTIQFCLQSNQDGTCQPGGDGGGWSSAEELAQYLSRSSSTVQALVAASTVVKISSWFDLGTCHLGYATNLRLCEFTLSPISHRLITIKWRGGLGGDFSSKMPVLHGVGNNVMAQIGTKW
jgi:hypothetical protein